MNIINAAKKIIDTKNIQNKSSIVHNDYTQIQNIEQQLHTLQNHIFSLYGCQREILWAEIFNNTISASSWLKNKSFSAGRWAVGYPYLYVLYRILDEIKPKNILELGLGQSSKMISQYADHNSDVSYQVVEHDLHWINFFSKNFTLTKNINIVNLAFTYENYKKAINVRVYEKFAENFGDKQFDLISIDAPIAGDMKDYARIDVIKILPNSLAENFVIMLDDVNRIGEQNTLSEIIDKLQQNNITHHVGIYSGEKDSVIICSEKLKFLTSL